VDGTVIEEETRASLATTYRRFAEVECHDYSPQYARLARSIAADEGLLRFIAALPDGQPNLFLASVQYVSGAAEDMPVDGAQLSEFVGEHGEEIAVLMRSRRTQTNEVGRCAALLPALPTGTPLAMIEVGASAGLCLLMDQFAYDYGGVRLGSPDASVAVTCMPVGSVPIPLPPEMPQIVWRRGLDLSPVDVRDDDDARWLLACVWSDHVGRRGRLQAAIELSRRDPPVVVRGDLVDDLPRLIDEAPEAATLVILHSAVLPYVAKDCRDRFTAVLARESKKRPIVWLSNEGPGIIPSLDALAPARDQLRFRVGRGWWDDGQVDQELLALAHYHGWDLEWLRDAPRSGARRRWC
jgi:hypothetical protein